MQSKRISKELDSNAPRTSPNTPLPAHARIKPPKSREYEEISLYTQDGSKIPEANKIKILGMITEANGANGETVKKFEGNVSSATRPIKRIPSNTLT